MVLETIREKIQLKKEKLKKQEMQIRHKERMLKNHEKKSQEKKMFELGNLAVQAQIDIIEPKALLGAFIEIAEKSHDKKTLQSWIEKSELHKKTNGTMQKILISFQKVPSQEIKNQLKQMNFRWNSFRGEYYGYAFKEELENLLTGLDYSLEIKD